MKSLILLVLAVVAMQVAVTDSAGTIEEHHQTVAEIKDAGTVSLSTNIIVGSTAGNLLLYRGKETYGGAQGKYQYLYVTYRTPVGRKIKAIHAIEQTPQGAKAGIIAGGIDDTFVTIRIQSAVSRGYDYLVTIWGK